MAEDFVILPDAEREIDEAYRWYKRRSPGPGEVFLSRLDAAFQTIRQSPMAFRQFARRTGARS